MAGSKMFVFDPKDLLRLITHYTDGKVPLNAEATNVLAHPHLERYIAIEAESEEWEEETPLHIRYAGKKVLAWRRGEGKEHPEWLEANYTPQRQ